jgi:DNA-binding MarR family transcriptional regulator
MVRKLETAGYVQRRPAPQDGRATIVELTAAGRNLTETIKALWVTLAQDTMADLTSPRGADVAALLTTLAANLTGRAAATA